MSDIEITTCKPEHADQVKEILVHAFSQGEPTTQGCTIGEPLDIDVWRVFIGEFIGECCAEGYSSVAIDKKTGKCVGTFICRDLHKPLSDELIQLLERFPRLGHAIWAIEKMDERFWDKYPQYADKPIGKVIDFWMVGVLPAYTGLGLSKLLTEKCRALIQDSSYEHAVMECTGHFSQRMATQSGFDLMYSYKYDEYLVDGKPIFTNVAEPHKEWHFYEKKLN